MGGCGFVCVCDCLDMNMDTLILTEPDSLRVYRVHGRTCKTTLNQRLFLG